MAATLALSLALTAANPAPAKARDDLASALAALQADDARLQSIGFRLTVANAEFCTDAVPAIGLLLQDMANYGNPQNMRDAAGIEGDFAVQASADGSPAALAGLAPNLEVTAIDGVAVGVARAQGKRDYRRLVALHDRIDAALAAKGSVAVTLTNGRTVKLEGEPACPSRFELETDGTRASADGFRVVFGRSFGRKPLLDEDEYAAAVAHELAHNLLAHRAWLDANGRGKRNVRATEAEADRLSVWLLANAGWEPETAARFMRRWGPRNDGGILRDGTHEAWDERADAMEAEAVRVRAAMDGDGRADWASGFARNLPEAD